MRTLDRGLRQWVLQLLFDTFSTFSTKEKLERVLVKSMNVFHYKHSLSKRTYIHVPDETRTPMTKFNIRDENVIWS